MKGSRIVLVLNVAILVSALAAVSVLGLIVLGGASSISSFSVGTPTTTSAGGVTKVVVPVTVGNRGYFALSGVYVQVGVKDGAGSSVLNGTVGPLSVGAGEKTTFNATLALDTAKLTSAELSSLATTTQNLTVSASLSATEPPFVGVSGSVTAQLKWGAPVTGLTVGAPAFSEYNSTAIEAKVPVSFTNGNGYLTISGDGKIAVLSQNGTQVGGGAVSLDVPPGGSFSSTVDIFVKTSSSQLLSLLTRDQTLSYTAVLSMPTGGGSPFTLDVPVSYQWGAPLAGLTLGTPQASAFNSTAFEVSVPVSFRDNSTSMGVSTALNVVILNSTTGAQVGGGSLSVQASPGTSFAQDMTVYVDFPASGFRSLLFNNATLSYVAQVSGVQAGASFAISQPVPVAWGAPVESLTVGAVSPAIYNSTDSSFSAPVSFTDGSAFLSLSGQVGGYITDSAGSTVGTVSQLQVTVGAGASFAGSLTGFIENFAVGQSSYVLHLTFTTPYGTAAIEETVSG